MDNKIKEDLIAVQSRLVRNHQQLTTLRDMFKDKSDKYDNLRMELMYDIMNDSIIDISLCTIMLSSMFLNKVEQ